MEIECQGCYYTLCSFVCLTEDLSEILQFLWRHGCLRRTYSCEKCGRKCAIGDKDLFFRCNRNTLDTPVTSPQVKNLAVQSSTQLSVKQTPSQIQYVILCIGFFIVASRSDRCMKLKGIIPQQMKF